MFSMTRLITSVVVMFAFMTLSTVGAQEIKPIDGGKGSEFSSKSFEIKEKGETAIVLTFEAGKEAIVTTSADKDTDVHLMVKGKYFEARDTSPNPSCLVKFTPVKGDEKFMLMLKNNGPGANNVTLTVKVAD